MATTQTRRPEVGDKAPDFTLNDADKKPISLHDFRGRTVVLVFFPAAFSGTCTSEMCSLQNSMAQLNRADAQVLGISVDLPYALKQFGEVNGIEFPLLSDFDRQVIPNYGIVDTNFSGYTSGVAQRSVFVIDGNGDIAWEWISESQGQEPPYDEVLTAAARTAQGAQGTSFTGS